MKNNTKLADPFDNSPTPRVPKLMAIMIPTSICNHVYIFIESAASNLTCIPINYRSLCIPRNLVKVVIMYLANNHLNPSF